MLTVILTETRGACARPAPSPCPSPGPGRCRPWRCPGPCPGPCPGCAGTCCSAPSLACSGRCCWRCRCAARGRRASAPDPGLGPGHTALSGVGAETTWCECQTSSWDFSYYYLLLFLVDIIFFSPSHHQLVPCCVEFLFIVKLMSM